MDLFKDFKALRGDYPILYEVPSLSLLLVLTPTRTLSPSLSRSLLPSPLRSLRKETQSSIEA